MTEKFKSESSEKTKLESRFSADSLWSKYFGFFFSPASVYDTSPAPSTADCAEEVVLIADCIISCCHSESDVNYMQIAG